MRLSTVTLSVLSTSLAFLATTSAAVQPSSFRLRKMEGDDEHNHGEEGEHEEGEHGHGDIAWAGIFDTPESSYIWIAQKKDGDYAEHTMKLVALPTASASDEMLESVEEEGEHSMEANCTVLHHGETIVPAEDVCYLLEFDDSRWETTYPIDASATNAIAFFAQHLPAEFEEDTHYLKLVVSGEDIDPVAEESGGHSEEEHEGEEHEGEEHDDKPWGWVILASLLVNVVTLSGVIFLIPAFRKSLDSKEGNKIADILIPAFAAGAIIATVLFLTLPEGLAKIQGHFMEGEEDGHEEGEHEEGEHEEGEHEHLRYRRFMEEEDHSDHGFEFMPSVTWRFATSLLAGFILPILLAMFFPRPEVPSSADEDDDFDDNEEKGEFFSNIFRRKLIFHFNHLNCSFSLVAITVNSTVIDEPQKKTLDVPLILSVLIGDFFHNFSDGVFIATAFMLCDQTKAWTITVVTLYHEIAQEIADYFILTRTAGLSPLKALVFNFISGLSVLIGGIVVLAGNFGDMGIGVFMAIASGTYLYVACVECLPRATNGAKDAFTFGLIVLFFAVGVVPVGLTLLNHSHCEEEGESHEGHGH